MKRAPVRQRRLDLRGETVRVLILDGTIPVVGGASTDTCILTAYCPPPTKPPKTKA